MTNRREFLKQGTLVAGAIAAEAAFRKAHGLTPLQKEPETPAMDAPTRDLMMEALNAAKLAGASLRRRPHRTLPPELRPDARAADRQRRRHRLDGRGVRALVDGTWGFAATRTLTKDGVAAAAKARSRDREGESRRGATSRSSSRRRRRIRT